LGNTHRSFVEARALLREAWLTLTLATMRVEAEYTKLSTLEEMRKASSHLEQFLFPSIG